MRIAVTLLEAFRLYEIGVLTAEQLVARITTTQPRTWRMDLGAAVDAIIEDPDAHRIAGGYAFGRFRFEAVDLEPVLATIDRSHADFQVPFERAYGAHVVATRVDYLRRGCLGEFKVRVGDVDAARSFDSMQWRFMADIVGALSVTYTTFRFSRDLRFLGAVSPGPWYPHAGLHGECCALLARFVAFVEARGLEGSLQGRARVLETPAFEDSPTRPPDPRADRFEQFLRERRAARAPQVVRLSSSTCTPAAPRGTAPGGQVSLF
jgi:hypothetical protein